MWGRQGTTSVVPEGVSNQLLFLAASAAEGRTSGAKAQRQRRGFSAWLKPCPDDFPPLYINGENALCPNPQQPGRVASQDRSTVGVAQRRRTEDMIYRVSVPLALIVGSYDNLAGADGCDQMPQG